MAKDTRGPGFEDEDDFGALTGGDSGLGNLPPLSDFDSGDDTGDSNLPPLGRLDSDGDSNISTPGGDIPSPRSLNMDTPRPLSTPPTRPSTPFTPPTPADPGGLITPEFSDAPAFDTPTSDLDTPEPSSGFGFQDLAADSDFSPETPEIGPGPDSDIETPMFDSAFGGDTGEFGSSSPPGFATPSPTQAMETPMFDASPSPVGGGGAFGFDNDAFGGAPRTPHTPHRAGGEFGTPIPDFSPDTGMPHAPTTGMTPQLPAGGRRSRGLSGVLVAVLIPLVALAIGIIAGPFIADSVQALPNPAKTKLDDKDKQIASMQQTINRMADVSPNTENQVTQEELEKRLAEFERVQAELNEGSSELARTLDQVQEAETTLTLIRNDIDQKNEEYVRAEELFEDLQNNTEITRSRHEGLLAENERLTQAVGELEDANIRRQATQQALVASLDRFVIQVAQGIPLTPSRYSHAERVQRSEDLRRKVQEAPWVTPELLNEFTQLVDTETEIASSREYFFAKIPVHDRLGTQETKWAECLMNGNWSVYYQTIDGAHAGSYENVSATSVPEYRFREDLPAPVIAEIRELITASRVEDYEAKIAVLEEKQKVYETQSSMQKKYSSL